jgi:hypothetical protein
LSIQSIGDYLSNVGSEFLAGVSWWVKSHEVLDIGIEVILLPVTIANCEEEVKEATEGWDSGLELLDSNDVFAGSHLTW